MAQYYKKLERGQIKLAVAPNPVKVVTGDGSVIDWHSHYGWETISKTEYEKLTVNSFIPGIKAKLQDSIDNDPDNFQWNYGDIMNTLPPISIGDEDLQDVIEKMLPKSEFKPTPKKGK